MFLGYEVYLILIILEITLEMTSSILVQLSIEAKENSRKKLFLSVNIPLINDIGSYFESTPRRSLKEAPSVSGTK